MRRLPERWRVRLSRTIEATAMRIEDLAGRVDGLAGEIWSHADHISFHVGRLASRIDHSSIRLYRLAAKIEFPKMTVPAGGWVSGGSPHAPWTTWMDEVSPERMAEVRAHIEERWGGEALPPPPPFSAAALAAIRAHPPESLWDAVQTQEPPT